MPAEVRVERPRNRDHGDWSTNIALQLAKGAGIPPRDLATSLADPPRGGARASRPSTSPGRASSTSPSTPRAPASSPASIVEAGRRLRHGTRRGRAASSTSSSSRPTPPGPLHIGHTRWAALGDAMRRLLAATGADGHRRVLHQRRRRADGQVRRLGAGAGRRASSPRRTATPASTSPTAPAEVLAQRPDLLDLPREEALVVARDLGYVAQLAAIRRTLDEFGVHFDVWFSERSLHEGGAVEEAVERLREQGHVFDERGRGVAAHHRLHRRQGPRPHPGQRRARRTSPPTPRTTSARRTAASTRRSTSSAPTTTATSTGSRRSRPAPVTTPSTTSRSRSASSSTSPAPRMGKRLGNAIYMDELIEWIGADAVRYSLARYPADSPLSLDGEELRKQTNDNPVFYVQYAHARTANVARLAAEDGVHRADGFDAVAALRPHRGRAARRPRRLPAGRRAGRAPPRAAPRRALPRGARRPASTSGTTPAGSAR